MEKVTYVQTLRDYLLSDIHKRIERLKFTGHPEKRLPGHTSFCVEGIEGESLVYMLSQQGIYANTGSACASKALKISPVLGAIGIPAEIAQGSIVFTFDKTNTIQEVKYLLDKMPPVVDRLRAMSPVWGRETPVYDESVCVAG